MTPIIIRFVLSDDTVIKQFYDVKSNPFKVGDKIKLCVSGISEPEFKSEKAVLENKKLSELYNDKTINLVKEYKFVDLELDTIEIEFDCIYI